MYLFARSIAFLVVLISISCPCVYAQQKKQDPAIEKIRAAFTEINSMPLTVEHYTYEAEGCVEDGRVDYFLDKQQVVKIKESGSIGDGSWTTEYYYRNGDCIFIYELLIGGPANGKVEKRAHRVYVKDGKVIRYMEDQKTSPADNKSAELTVTAIKLLKARTTKNFAAALCGN